MFLKHFLTSISLLICLVPQHLVAQSNTEDVIYLKDGGILRGEIIERTEDVLKIKTVARNVFVVQRVEIQKVTVEKIPRVKKLKQSGYINNTGFSLLPDRNAVTVRFEMVNGYQFTPLLSAGIGVGLTLYQDPVNLVPVFLDVTYKLVDARTAPFVSFRGGYSFSVMADNESQFDNHKGGFMFNPGVGLQFDINERVGIYFSAGYNLDNSTQEQTTWGGNLETTEINYRRAQLGFGLSF